MPKPPTIALRPTPREEPGRGYVMKVEKVSKTAEGWSVLLRHWDEPLRGASREFVLSDGAAAGCTSGQLFESCGINGDEDKNVDPRSLAGNFLVAGLDLSPAGNLEIIRFEPYTSGTGRKAPV